MSDIEKELTASKVTPQRIAQVVKNVFYFTGEDAYFGNILLSDSKSIPEPIGDMDELEGPSSLSLLTFCVIELVNGFTVVGYSACVSPENFDLSIGKEVAYKKAEDQIWALEGYLLKQQLSESTSLT